MQKISKIIGLLTAFLLFGASLWTVFNWQLVVDYASVYDFTPDQEVKALVTDSGMSEKGEFHFYSSYPKITDAEEFNSACQRQEQSSPILGCYVSKTNRIFIYNVDNQDLKGIKEVTAAHEMLHVAYSRLSQRERDWLEPRLEAAYSRLANDKLRTRMDYYAKAEPGEKLNELHSILPTEYADLGQELNDYYAKYFDNRQAAIKLYSDYSQVFYELEDEARGLESKLESDVKQINADTSQYQADIQMFNQEVATFNQRASSGYFKSQTEFNSARSELVARTYAFEARKTALDQKIDEYNVNVDRLNQLGLKIDKLNKSIDSHKGVE